MAVSVIAPPPTAGSAIYTVKAGQTVTAGATGGDSLAAKCADPSGGALTFSAASAPQHGALSFNSNGSFTYTPDSTFTGLDSFTYIVNDGFNSSQPAIVNFTNPGAHYDPSKRHIPIISTAGASAASVQRSYDAAQLDLRVVMTDFQTVGQVSQAMSQATSPSVSLMNVGMRAAESLQAAYDKYVAQVYETVAGLGRYIEDAGMFVDNDLIAKVNKMSVYVVGLRPGADETAALAAAANSLSNGASVALDKVNFTIDVLETTHAACETAIAATGAAALLDTGIQLATEEGCAAFASYTAKQLVNLAAAQVVNLGMQAALRVAVQYGLNPQYVQIGADALQLFFLMRALKAQRGDRPRNCFTGNTNVATSNHGEQAIDTVHIGERVQTAVNDGNDPGGSAAADR